MKPEQFEKEYLDIMQGYNPEQVARQLKRLKIAIFERKATGRYVAWNVINNHGVFSYSFDMLQKQIIYPQCYLKDTP